MKRKITKYSQHYNYELLAFSSKVACPGNKLLRSSIWVIILSELSTSLIRHEPFDTQNDSITLFIQSFLHFDHMNL